MALNHTKVVVTADDGTSEVGSDEWNAEHVPDANGIKFTAGSTDPATPASGFLNIYAKVIAGRAMPKAIGPSGVSYPLQASIFANRVMFWSPLTGTSLVYLGASGQVGATLSHPTPAASSLGQSMSRARFTTSTTAGNAAGVRGVVNTILFGNASARGGFFFNARFLNGSLHTNGVQKCVGLSSNTSLLAGEPSSSLTDFVGMCLDSGDTTWQFSRRTGSGTATKVNLGVTPAADQVFDLTMFTVPGGTTLYVRILQYANDGTFTTVLDTSYNTVLPAVTTFLSPRIEVRNGALAAAHNIEFASLYVESDF